MSSNYEEACNFAMQLVTSSVLPMVFKTAIELGVFEIMAKAREGLTAGDIAGQLTTKNPEATAMLERMLRLLAAHEVVLVSTTFSPKTEGDTQRRYSLAPACELFVKSKDGASFAPAVLFIQDKVYMESWYHLKDAVLEGGIPFNRAHNMSPFEYAGKDARLNKLFNDGMLTTSGVVMKNILDAYIGFKGLTSLVDVGGGVGSNLRLIMAKYPNIKGINFDLPHVIESATQLVGVQHIAGDMFIEVPKGEAIFMKWILHDWGDDHCVKLLKNCYNSLPEHGKVILIEYVVPEVPDTSYASKTVIQSDCFMLVQNPGGKERTRKEFEKLITAAGFIAIKLIYCVSNLWVIEVFKK